MSSPAATDARVRVEYSATIARAIGADEEAYPAGANGRLAGLLEDIATRHGDAARGALLDGSGGLLPSVIAAVNGSQTPAGGDAPVRSGDDVLFLSAVGGG